ncbi:2-isopropylmalate synthase [Candidatus Woesearchaeota archaeon]|nr:2-isopropylmalate synthase [Candidatus Woesearchaeota archaeon]
MKKTKKPRIRVPKQRVRILDTTLRDGEQAAHGTILPHEKLEIALLLSRMGVDAIEAGFPVSSQGDYEAVSMIAGEVRGAYIAGLARAVEADIERAWDALKYSEKPVIHTFIGTSPVQMATQLKKSPKEVLKMAEEAVRCAKGCAGSKGYVQFSPMDATRTEPAFLHEVIQAAIEAGADIINIPDTVGYATTDEFENIIKDVRENVPDIGQAILSVHCHDDLDLAVANSMKAVQMGVEQVECTVNGIGERAGNAALETIVMGLKVREDWYGKRTKVKTRYIAKASDMVGKYTGLPVPQNHPVVGEGVFDHSSGIHSDGVLKDRENFEIMDPTHIGREGDVSKRIPIGARTGRKGVAANARRLGYDLSPEEAEKTYELAMNIADMKKEVTDDDLRVIIEDDVRGYAGTYELISFQASSTQGEGCTAKVVLGYDGAVSKEAACGDGPVDAAGIAIEKMTGRRIRVDDFKLDAITGGKDAIGEVTLYASDNGHKVVAKGASTNIVEASVKAYVNALNKIMFYQQTQEK